MHSSRALQDAPCTVNATAGMLMRTVLWLLLYRAW
jgi:hypothetical protein